MTTSNGVTARTPGKLILSGEHAVVHGAPALALAVNRYIETTVNKGTGPNILFDIKSLGLQKHIPVVILHKIKEKIKKQYKLFKQGELSISKVLKQPLELAMFTFANVVDGIKGSDHGSEIAVHSDIPVSCGMGSSAASTVSLLTALNSAYSLKLSNDKIIEYAIESECLQHGRSSGLDVHVVSEGGCLYFHEGETEKREVPQLPLFLVHSGKPSSSTGDCVEHVAEKFSGSNLCQSFENVTHHIDEALKQNDQDNLIKAFKENHQLLVDIGVVPKPIQQFISALEQQQLGAKISGAGAISGKNAGMVLISGNQESANRVAQEFGYSLEPIQGTRHGSHIL